MYICQTINTSFGQRNGYQPVGGPWIPEFWVSRAVIGPKLPPCDVQWFNTNPLYHVEMIICFLITEPILIVDVILNSTPLSYAVEHASLPLVSLLLNRGGDITEGQVLHHAVSRNSDAVELPKLLLLDQRYHVSMPSAFLGHEFLSGGNCSAQGSISLQIRCHPFPS